MTRKLRCYGATDRGTRFVIFATSLPKARQLLAQCATGARLHSSLYSFRLQCERTHNEAEMELCDDESVWSYPVTRGGVWAAKRLSVAELTR